MKQNRMIFLFKIYSYPLTLPNRCISESVSLCIQQGTIYAQELFTLDVDKSTEVNILRRVVQTKKSLLDHVRK